MLAENARTFARPHTLRVTLYTCLAGGAHLVPGDEEVSDTPPPVHYRLSAGTTHTNVITRKHTHT